MHSFVSAISLGGFAPKSGAARRRARPTPVPTQTALRHRLRKTRIWQSLVCEKVEPVASHWTVNCILGRGLASRGRHGRADYCKRASHAAFDWCTKNQACMCTMHVTACACMVCRFSQQRYSSMSFLSCGALQHVFFVWRPGVFPRATSSAGHTHESNPRKCKQTRVHSLSL